MPDTEIPTSKSSMSVEMAKLICSNCKAAELDTMYGNPPLQPSTRCNCSGCVPLEMPKKPPQRRPKGEVQLNLTKEMKELATKRLIGFQREIYLTTDPKTSLVHSLFSHDYFPADSSPEWLACYSNSPRGLSMT